MLKVGTEVGTVAIVRSSTEKRVSRALNKLTARQVSALKEVGRHADGGGLYLRITAAGLAFLGLHGHRWWSAR